MQTARLHPQQDVQNIVQAAREQGFTVAQLCAAASPPVNVSQVSRWLRWQEPRANQVERLRLALLHLMTTPTE